MNKTTRKKKKKNKKNKKIKQSKQKQVFVGSNAQHMH